MRLELESLEPNILSVTLHKLRGKMPGAKTQITLGEQTTERTLLDKLPVNIQYPKTPQTDFPLLQKDDVQHLNT